MMEQFDGLRRASREAVSWNHFARERQKIAFLLDPQVEDAMGPTAGAHLNRCAVLSPSNRIGNAPGHKCAHSRRAFAYHWDMHSSTTCWRTAVGVALA